MIDESTTALILDIVGWMGTIIGIILCLSPVISFSQIIKGQSTLEIIPTSMIYSQIFCNILCLCYYLRLNVFIGIFSSAVSIVIWLIFYVLYYFLKYRKNFMRFILSILIGFSLTYAYYYIFLYIIPETKQVGAVSMVFNIIASASPGQKILNVIKTKNYQLIPIGTVVTGLFCSLCWLAFGSIRGDVNSIITNVISILLSCINIFVWTYFYLRRNKVEDTKKKI